VTTVFGRITDCQTGEPIEDGIMLVAFEQSFHQEIYIQNGYFEFEVFECLLGSTIEIFPQFDFGPTFPILLSTEDHFGSEEWDLGEISFCEETTGSGELLINGVDSVHLGEVVAIHFEDRFIILSEQFIAELEIEDSEIIGFHSIQQLINNFDQFSSLNKDAIDIQIEVEEYTGEPGTPLVINFNGQFIDDFSFQNISISGHINTQVF
jgi:hypothetical protein